MGKWETHALPVEMQNAQLLWKQPANFSKSETQSYPRAQQFSSQVHIKKNQKHIAHTKICS